MQTLPRTESSAARLAPRPRAKCARFQSRADRRTTNPKECCAARTPIFLAKTACRSPGSQIASASGRIYHGAMRVPILCLSVASHGVIDGQNAPTPFGQFPRRPAICWHVPSADDQYIRVKRRSLSASGANSALDCHTRRFRIHANWSSLKGACCKGAWWLTNNSTPSRLASSFMQAFRYPDSAVQRTAILMQSLFPLPELSTTMLCEAEKCP